MDAWAALWGWILIGVFTVFAVLSVVITIGGFFDVRSLFSTIDQQHDKKRGEAESAEDG